MSQRPAAMAAAILHADADAFFAAVEQRDRPRLRGRPTLVGKGVVLAASYEARAKGVRSGMGGARARRLCPEAIAVEPRFSAYLEASRELFAVFRETAPVVEGLSLEEAFLDVRGLEHVKGSPATVAARLRRDVRRKVGLAVTVGIARTRLLAKMASRAAKPDGLLVVAPQREREFLHPLSVDDVWGIGPKTAARLRRHGLTTVGQLVGRSENELAMLLGAAAGRRLRALLSGRESRVVRRRGRGSFGSQRAMRRSAGTPGRLDETLLALVDRITGRMRRSNRAGRTVVLRLRFGDYSRATRSRTLAHSTSASATVLLVARVLLDEALPQIEARGLTLVGLSVSNLDAKGTGTQLALPIERRASSELESALDELRERYGSSAVTRASLLRSGSRGPPDAPG